MKVSARRRTVALTVLVLIAAADAYAQISFRGAASASAQGITPTFRAAASGASRTGRLSLNKPAGTAAGDVLIASVAVRPSTAAITPPAGWTLVRRLDNADAASNSLAVFYKVALTNEPASYFWDVRGANFSVGGVQGFRGIDTANPIDAESGQNTPLGRSHAAPPITTSIANAMLVSTHAFASSETWDPPNGMIESLARRSEGGAGGISIEANRALQPVAGSTGSKVATADGNADVGNAHLLALRPAGVNLSIATPAGTAAGDVMVAAIAFNNSGASLTPPPDWILVRRMNNAARTSNALAVYRKTAASDGPATHVWRVAGGAFIVGGIQSFSRVDTANPIDAESGQSTPSGTHHETPSITTRSANAMVVTAHSYAAAQDWTAQAGLTEAFDRASGLGPIGQSITGAYQLQADPAPSGAKRSTAASSADVGNTHILALRPAVINTPPTVSISSPLEGANFSAPANIVLTATASDAEGAIQKVEFFHGGNNLIVSLTAAPYSITWTGVPQGAYSLTAVVTDNQNTSTTSAPVTVTVNREPALHFVHVDHLNTPRLVADAAQQMVWRWDVEEPFGANAPSQNPAGVGTFNQPLRFPGQYFDVETHLHYNYHRDYDASLGIYKQGDPIGLKGGLNLYAYAFGQPLVAVDPKGLEVEVGVRKFYPIGLPIVRHCFARFKGDNGNTLGFDSRGVAPDVNPGGATYSRTVGPENDSCVREQMLKCRDYAFFTNNCCDCVAYALDNCGLSKVGTWPNLIPAGPFRQPAPPSMCGEQGCQFP